MSARNGFAHIILIAVLASTIIVFGLVYLKSLQKTSYTNPNTVKTPTSTVSPSPSQNNNDQLPIVQLVKEDLSNLLKITENSIEVLSVEKVNWSDSCLGVDIGELCAQAITPGYKISLKGTDNKIYIYHTDLNKYFIIERPILGNL